MQSSVCWTTVPNGSQPTSLLFLIPSHGTETALSQTNKTIYQHDWFWRSPNNSFEMFFVNQEMLLIKFSANLKDCAVSFYIVVFILRPSWTLSAVHFAMVFLLLKSSHFWSLHWLNSGEIRSFFPLPKVSLSGTKHPVNSLFLKAGLHNIALSISHLPIDYWKTVTF